MNILRMTPAKRNHLRLLYRIRRMKPLRHKVLYPMHIRLDPLLQLKVKSPQVVEIRRVRLTAHDDHVLPNKSAGMVRARRRDDWLLAFLDFDVLSDQVFGEVNLPLFALALGVTQLLLAEGGEAVAVVVGAELVGVRELTVLFEGLGIERESPLLICHLRTHQGKLRVIHELLVVHVELLGTLVTSIVILTRDVRKLKT